MPLHKTPWSWWLISPPATHLIRHCSLPMSTSRCNRCMRSFLIKTSFLLSRLVFRVLWLVSQRPSLTSSPSSKVVMYLCGTLQSPLLLWLHVGKWLHNQRQLKRKGMLRSDRCDILQKLVNEGKLLWFIGVKDDVKWDVMYSALVRYGKSHGNNCNVPHRYITVTSTR